MNVVDSCGWLEYFADGPNAKYFASALEDTEHLLVPAICVYEVFKRTFQQRGEEMALQAAGLMSQATIISIDDAVALNAARYSCEYKLPMADSIVYAVARMNQATILTQDDDFKNLPSVKYFPSKK